MSDTTKIETEQNGTVEPKKVSKVKPWMVFLLVVLGLGLIMTALYFSWLKPMIAKPLGATLSIPQTSAATNTPAPVIDLSGITTTVTVEPKATNTPVNTIVPTKAPVCGDEAVWHVLMVGVDSSGYHFSAGLSDVIRIARVDFREMKVDMLALPRDLVVNAPEGLFKEENPMKINQGYLFGTTGWVGSDEKGNGAVTLAKVIYANFGVVIDHYMVVNFTGVEEFIDALGGVTVNLPQGVYPPNPSFCCFDPGLQTLSGERALDLMRIREGYSDAFRVGNQSIVMKAVLKQLLDPAMILKIPELIKTFNTSFLTDLSIEQLISLGTCFLKNFDTDNLNSQQVPDEYITADWEYIPTLFGNSYVYRWDQKLIDWIHGIVPNK